jgi:hypothetical protein
MTMLSDTPPEHEALYDALRRAAALRDTFQPMQLLQDAQRMAGDGAVSDDPVIMAEALSALQADCVVDRGTAGPIWSLRPAVRRKVLGQGEDPAFDRAMAQGEGPVVEALRGTGAFSSDALQAALAPQVPSQTLTHLVGTLDRAGPRAPGYQALIALRSAMNTAEQRDRVAWVFRAARRTGATGVVDCDAANLNPAAHAAYLGTAGNREILLAGENHSRGCGSR